MMASAPFRFLLTVCAASFALLASAVEWKNLDDDHYVSGRKCSAGYLTGKVVLVCKAKPLVQRLEEIWTSFKMKPFVLLGSYSRKPKNTSYPVYKDVALEGKTPDVPIFVVDGTGRIRYMGADERRATELVVTCLTDMESPKSEEQWRQFLDFEFASLPGRAYLRYQDFKQKFPAGAKDYAAKFGELSKMPDVKKLSDLVRFAKEVKDLRAINPKKAKTVKPKLKEKIELAEKAFAPLKESANPLVVQEAKNALADLAWAKAVL